MPEVLEMIYNEIEKVRKGQDKLTEAHSKDQRELRECMTKMKVGAEKQNGRLYAVEKGVDNLTVDMKEHLKDESSHYKPHFSESFGQKMWRKRAEIGVSSGSSITTVLIIIFRDAIIKALGG